MALRDVKTEEPGPPVGAVPQAAEETSHLVVLGAADVAQALTAEPGAQRGEQPPLRVSHHEANRTGRVLMHSQCGEVLRSEPEPSGDLLSGDRLPDLSPLVPRLGGDAVEASRVLIADSEVPPCEGQPLSEGRRYVDSVRADDAVSRQLGVVARRRHEVQTA